MQLILHVFSGRKVHGRPSAKQKHLVSKMRSEYFWKTIFLFWKGKFSGAMLNFGDVDA